MFLITFYIIAKYDPSKFPPFIEYDDFENRMIIKQWDVFGTLLLDTLEINQGVLVYYELYGNIPLYTYVNLSMIKVDGKDSIFYALNL